MVEEPQRGGQETGEGTGIGDKKAGIRGEENRGSVIVCGSPGAWVGSPCKGSKQQWQIHPGLKMKVCV